MPYEPDQNTASDELEFPVDLSLPDDLALLGEQLSDDARFLAAEYPAQSRETWSAAAEDSPRPAPSGVPWLRVAAALLLSLGVGTGLFGLAQFAGVAHFAAPGSDNAGDPASLHEVGVNAVGSRRDALSQPGEHQLSPVGDAPLMARSPAKPSNRERLNAPSAGDEAVEDAGLLAVPPVQFQALSGPEQEAFLDLIESQGLIEPSLSI